MKGLVVLLCALGAARGQAMPKEFAQALERLGRPGEYRDEALTVGLPRSDLKLAVEGVAAPAPGGWLVFTQGGLTGELVLVEQEVNPVLSALLKNGVEALALENAFLFDEPRVFWMRIAGRGPAPELARRLKPALDLLGHVPRPPAAAYPAVTITLRRGLDTAKLARIVGHAGQGSGSAYRVDAGGSRAAFSGSDDDAAVAGEIATTESGLQAALKALRAHGLQVVSIHPRRVRFWGTGLAEKLAAGFKAALSAPGAPPADGRRGPGR